MTRVALYARYSSDNQREASIEDQFRLCEEHAAREGWGIVERHSDAAISGSSTILRPGIQQLVREAQSGRYDVVLAEALDRISRDQADVATLFKHLKFAGVTIVTLAEGEISELHVGLKGTMNALFLKDLADKTRRGLRGRVEKGKSGGGNAYGYRVVKQYDAHGEPIRGDREIVPEEAEIVRRIFRDFAAGVSPRNIAKALNKEGIPGPNGKLWNNTTLRGHVSRGTGIVNNELYIGRLVWNRLRYMKDPSTGKRVSRLNPESEWIITEVPELRIVPDELWKAAKAKQAELTDKYANVIAAVRQHHRTNRLNGTHRPKSLLSGLIFCGCCGGPYSLRGQARFACSAHVTNNSCSNSRTISREDLETRVLAGLKDRMMAPEAAEAAMRAFAEETNRLNRERRSSGELARVELAKVDKALKEIVQAIEDGGYSRMLMDRLRELETRQEALQERMATTPEPLPDIHPNVAHIYRRKVERLAEALNHPKERQEAAEALRGLIERVVLTPGPKRGQIDATLHGELGTILEWVERQAAGKSAKKNTPRGDSSGVSVSVVAGVGFEPTTFRL
ncbi:recombinase family protein [Mesorhizobium sp. J18]|uniref:recombinase family protein n=1 Tax=Mesorhizobium sp. J18 TaxID=935263 RepID=UPI0011A8E5B9|nr:recombinase family protein [Mesorhizobium sp. J18]